jgi:hypothetical protein
VTYYVNGDPASKSGPEADARGNLSDLRPWLESIDHSALISSFKTIDAVLGILLASPASLAGMCEDVQLPAWLQEPTPGDWALTEIICHLRDAEREIHHAQIKLFKEQAEPFIPRMEAAVWARQRNYLNENGASALKEFTAARIETLAMLKEVSAKDWQCKARHAIFGPTNFLEVVGFIAEHDRMHIQQAWKVINEITS